MTFLGGSGASFSFAIANCGQPGGALAAVRPGEWSVGTCVCDENEEVKLLKRVDAEKLETEAVFVAAALSVPKSFTLKRLPEASTGG